MVHIEKTANSMRSGVFCVIVSLLALGSKGPQPTNKETQELSAYMVYTRGVENPAKNLYMKQLSPGGRVYFLACRRDYAQALAELDKLSKRNTGSGLYIRAFCLDGLGLHAEAVEAFKQAQSKVDLIFNPSFKFYLQYATALAGAKKELECLAMLNTAVEKLNTSKPNKKQEIELFVTVRRRKLALAEKFGRYKEGCNRYMLDMGLDKPLLNIDRPPVSDDDSRTKAKAWLKNNPAPPQTDMRDEFAQYLFMKGQSCLALGQTQEARKYLNAVLDVHPLEESYVVSNRTDSRYGDLGRTQKAARVLLIRMSYASKDYQECCKHLRRIIGFDPYREFSNHFATIAMKDVPQIVLDKDLAAHSEDVERRLDRDPLIVDIPRKRKWLSKEPFANNPHLKMARAQIEQKQFRQCYITLNELMRECTRMCAHPKGYAELDKKEAFLEDTVFRVRMLQIGAGLAAEMPYQGLSFNGAKPFDNEEKEISNLGLVRPHKIDPAVVPNWSYIEDKLTGRTKHEINDPQAAKNPQFEPWCHFASGLRCMSQKDYKNAEGEFAAVNWKQKPSDDLNAYARILGQVCKGRLKATNSWMRTNKIRPQFSARFPSVL